MDFAKRLGGYTQISHLPMVPAFRFHHPEHFLNPGLNQCRLFLYQMYDFSVNNSMMFLAASLMGICFQKVRSQSVRRFFIKSPMLTGTVKGKQTKSGGFRLLKQFERISITLQKVFKRSFFSLSVHEMGKLLFPGIQETVHLNPPAMGIPTRQYEDAGNPFSIAAPE